MRPAGEREEQAFGVRSSILADSSFCVMRLKWTQYLAWSDFQALSKQRVSPSKHMELGGALDADGEELIYAFMKLHGAISYIKEWNPWQKGQSILYGSPASGATIIIGIISRKWNTFIMGTHDFCTCFNSFVSPCTFPATNYC